MARNLHSFTLTDDASYEVKRMKRGSKSAQVSLAIVKYANDYKLSPDGVKFWENLRDLEAAAKQKAWREILDLRRQGGVKYHFFKLLECLNPFRPKKQVEQQEQ